MARKRKKREEHAGELNLTAMIDVAFQLLSFFIITVKPMDVLTNLEVSQPSASNRTEDKKVSAKGFLKIQVFSDRYNVNDLTMVNEADLQRNILRQGEIDPNQTVLIMAYADSAHRRLIKVLDLCQAGKLVNISVMSAQ